TGLPGALVADATLVLGSLLMVRALMGALSAPIYPASGRVIAHWIPRRQRAMTNGLITCAAILGNASTYLVFGGLMVRVGRPFAVVLPGAATAGLALVWMLYATNDPAQHRAVNDAERALIGGPSMLMPEETDQFALTDQGDATDIQKPESRR